MMLHRHFERLREEQAVTVKARTEPVQAEQPKEEPAKKGKKRKAE